MGKVMVGNIICEGRLEIRLWKALYIIPRNLQVAVLGIQTQQNLKHENDNQICALDRQLWMESEAQIKMGRDGRRKTV